ncbi:MAG: hypothetical protein ACREF4_13260 [Gammaproteobacteria bacterium]
MTAAPAESAALLRAMDENLWAMERDGTRMARGEVRETHSPWGVRSTSGGASAPSRRIGCS